MRNELTVYVGCCKNLPGLVSVLHPPCQMPSKLVKRHCLSYLGMENLAPTVSGHLQPTVAPVRIRLRQPRKPLSSAMDTNTIRQTLLQRNPGMTPQQFSHQWFTQHAPLVVPLFLYSGVLHYEQARDYPPFLSIRQRPLIIASSLANAVLPIAIAPIPSPPAPPSLLFTPRFCHISGGIDDNSALGAP
jgi:hypothetical protein